jgi:hypothetical protein
MQLRRAALSPRRHLKTGRVGSPSRGPFGSAGTAMLI